MVKRQFNLFLESTTETINNVNVTDIMIWNILELAGLLTSINSLRLLLYFAGAGAVMLTFVCCLFKLVIILINHSWF